MDVKFNTKQQAGYVIRLTPEEMTQLHEIFPQIGKTLSIPDVLQDMIQAEFDKFRIKTY